MGSRRSGGMFWALILIGIGMIFLLQNLGVLSGDVWGNIWPLFLIILGLALLWGTFGQRRGGQLATTQSVPLEGATEARVELEYGAGRLRIGAGSDAATLVSGTASEGFEYRSHRSGDRLDVKLSRTRDWWSWMWPGNWGSAMNDWSLKLNRDISLALHLKTGASESDIDLHDLRVRDLSMETGASSVKLTLPAKGRTSATIKAGAAEVRVRVPQDVAARIRTNTGMATVKVDQARFPSNGGSYQSPNFDTAENRADIYIEGGMATFEVG